VTDTEGARQMRYFFHVMDGDTTIRDHEGQLIEHFGDVKEEAYQAARDLLADRVKHGVPLRGQAFVVQDSSGRTVLELPFRTILGIAD